MAQKVIIPKGLVNPDETTIVEIPEDFKNIGTVVARLKKKGPNPEDWSFPSSSDSSARPSPDNPPPGQHVVKKRTYLRKTHPRPNQPLDLTRAGLTFGGRPNIDDSDAGTSFVPSFIQNRPEPSPAVPYQGFNPPLSSTVGDLDWSGWKESMYRDFRPAKPGSTPIQRANTPGYTPPSLERYQSAPLRVTKKSSVTRCSPDEYTQEETEESYDEPSSDPMSSSACPSSSPCPGDSSGGYKPYGLGDSSGAYQGYSPVDTSNLGSPGVSGDQMSYMLSQIESQEQEQIMRDMSAYQDARRRLLFDASSLASAADVSARLVGNNTI